MPSSVHELLCVLFCVFLERPSEVGGIIPLVLFRTLKLSAVNNLHKTTQLVHWICSSNWVLWHGHVAMGMSTLTLSLIREGLWRIFVFYQSRLRDVCTV